MLVTLMPGTHVLTGDLIMFRDTDDFLLPAAATQTIDNYDPKIAIYHYRMRYADKVDSLPGIHPAPELKLADGDFSEQLRASSRQMARIASGLLLSR